MRLYIDVGQVITVVVDAIADLISIGADGWIEVVAVGALGHVASGCGALGDVPFTGASIAVFIDIDVPRGRIGGVFIGLSIAVVVGLIADFDAVWTDGDVGVIAVLVVFGVAFGCCTGFHRCIGIPIAIFIGVWVEGDSVFRVFVEFPIAVVVEPITGFDPTWECGGCIIVAVGGVGDISIGLIACGHARFGITKAIAIGIGVPHGCTLYIDIGQFIAVVVDAIADFIGIGAYGRVEVVAVGIVVDVARGGLTRGHIPVSRRTIAI